jgi:hypothetical protein
MTRVDRIRVELSNEDRKILRDIRDALRANGAPQFTGRLVETDVDEILRRSKVIR